MSFGQDSSFAFVSGIPFFPGEYGRARYLYVQGDALQPSVYWVVFVVVQRRARQFIIIEATRSQVDSTYLDVDSFYGVGIPNDRAVRKLAKERKALNRASSDCGRRAGIRGAQFLMR